MTYHCRPLKNPVAVLALAGLATFATAQPDPAGRWEGTIGPGVIDLGIVVVLEPDAGTWTGSIDIPVQGAVELPLRDVIVEGTRVRFAIDGVPGDPTFDGLLDGDRLEGTFVQGGQELTFELTRFGEGAVGPAAGPAVEPAYLGQWEGLLGPGVIDLAVIVRFSEQEGTLIGHIDVPLQSLENLPLEIREVGPEGITFAIPGIPGDPTFVGSLEGDTLSGDFSQAGGGLTFELTRLAEGEVPTGLVRPQEPLPPFPYEQEEVAYLNEGVELAGTLTLPAGPGPHPAVIMITGSGPQDRDEALAGHKPFLVVADALTRAGFAVLRSDDRGVGGSGGDLAQATYDDLVGDVLSAVALLRSRSDIDPGRVGLFGHSEGGLLAPLAADRSSDVAFVVLMAGPAVSSLEVLKIQNLLIYRLAGADEATIEDQLAYLDDLYELMVRGDLAGVEELVRDQVEEQLEALPAEQRLDPVERQAIIAAQVASTATPAFRSFMLYDPQPVLRRLTVPVLAFYGKLDIQVPAVQSAGRLSGALRVAGNSDYTVEVFDGLNHLMQPAITGAIEEYGQIETTIAPEVLELVIDWLAARFLDRP